MKPYIEEAWRMLKLAGRDARAFEVLAESGDVHNSIVCFHAQQAIEKSMKAVLFSLCIEFRRTHSLTDLSTLLRENAYVIPLTDDRLIRLNPFAVTFRYDDMVIPILDTKEVHVWVSEMMKWSESIIRDAEDTNDTQ